MRLLENVFQSQGAITISCEYSGMIGPSGVLLHRVGLLEGE